MMRQTSSSLAICFKLLMTVIRILSDISVMLIYWTWSTGSRHCPYNIRSWMASSFSGWGGCHSYRHHGDWTVVLYSIICTPHMNLHDSKLGKICVTTNRRNHCISWPIMPVPSTETNLYLHIQIGSYKYPHLKILLGNEWCDNLSLYTVFYLDGSMSSAIGVKQRQGDQLQLFSLLMCCLCIAGDDCCNHA